MEYHKGVTRVRFLQELVLKWEISKEGAVTQRFVKASQDPVECWENSELRTHCCEK